MSVVNRPRVSKAIARVYYGMVAFVGFISLVFILLGVITPFGVWGIVGGTLVLVLIEPVFALVVASLYRTRYVLSEAELLIKTTALIGGDKRVPLDEVESVERTLIPWGFKLFGASLHGGYYSVPGLGWAFLAITNFEDGVLIRTRKRSYIITPRDPDAFEEAIRARKAPRAAP